MTWGIIDTSINVVDSSCCCDYIISAFQNSFIGSLIGDRTISRNRTGSGIGCGAFFTVRLALTVVIQILFMKKKKKTFSVFRHSEGTLWIWKGEQVG